MAKRSASLPSIRVTEQLEVSLMRSAAREKRELSEYIRYILELHQFGHDFSLVQDGETCQQCSASQCDARKSRARADD